MRKGVALAPGSISCLGPLESELTRLNPEPRPLPAAAGLCTAGTPPQPLAPPLLLDFPTVSQPICSRLLLPILQLHHGLFLFRHSRWLMPFCSIRVPYEMEKES